MLYNRIKPHPDLSPFVDCYWVIESNDSPDPTRQKIIPDGFTELIYHYGDTYRISLHGIWEDQHNKLLAGQIDRHFYIENTGKTGMVGIKWRPEALALLFDLEMSLYANNVVSLSDIPALEEVSNLLHEEWHSDLVDNIENYLLAKTSRIEPHPIQHAVSLIFEHNGMTSVKAVTEKLNVSQRQVERYFKKYIGLSPKLFMRIIRFNYIFELMKNDDNNWQDIVFQSGYYDQAHFIKNFQEFTGEDPTRYGFEERSIANFFLKKPDE